MTAEDQAKIIRDNRHKLYRALLTSGVDFSAITQIAASRIRQREQEALSAKTIEGLRKLEGMAEEARFWMNLQGRMDDELQAEAKAQQ